jgi:hypothetical protein
MTKYQRVQAELIREAGLRLCAHYRKHGKDAKAPTYLRGFIEGGVFALLTAGVITLPKKKRPTPRRSGEEGV